jgi:hypothetical protein
VIGPRRCWLLQFPIRRQKVTVPQPRHGNHNKADNAAVPGTTSSDVLTQAHARVPDFVEMGDVLQSFRGALRPRWANILVPLVVRI